MAYRVELEVEGTITRAYHRHAACHSCSLTLQASVHRKQVISHGFNQGQRLGSCTAGLQRKVRFMDFLPGIVQAWELVAISVVEPPPSLVGSLLVVKEIVLRCFPANQDIVLRCFPANQDIVLQLRWSFLQCGPENLPEGSMEAIR
ncbi:hypothetical protein MLD38_010367 [Melastoma candidum]|uniref:Uncharacterized protein n=1 Tax=Melastoma candidum TaxID=119954 RepID=A0ACB9R1F0_9MYRT|nr:hypothetical protein MLD38_010367 [Melastoma candidum]